MGFFSIITITGKKKKKLNIKAGYRKFSTKNSPGYSFILPIASILLSGEKKQCQNQQKKNTE